MSAAFTESVVEQDALVWLESMGYLDKAMTQQAEPNQQMERYGCP